MSEERKGRSKEDRKQEKEKNEAIQKEYGIAVIDGHEEKIGNFRIEPPGLFRGRGEHPKQVFPSPPLRLNTLYPRCGSGLQWYLLEESRVWM